MVKFIFTTVMVLMFPWTAFCECTVIEHPDHNEVVCEGVPLAPEEKEKLDNKRKGQEKLDQLRSELADLKQKNEQKRQQIELDNTVDISALDMRLVESGRYLNKYSFKFDAYNPGRAGQIFFKINLVDSKGFLLDSFRTSSHLAANQKKTVTETHILTHGFDKWSVTVSEKY